MSHDAESADPNPAGVRHAVRHKSHAVKISQPGTPLPPGTGPQVNYLTHGLPAKRQPVELTPSRLQSLWAWSRRTGCPVVLKLLAPKVKALLCSPLVRTGAPVNYSGLRRWLCTAAGSPANAETWLGSQVSAHRFCRSTSPPRHVISAQTEQVASSPSPHVSRCRVRRPKPRQLETWPPAQASHRQPEPLEARVPSGTKPQVNCLTYGPLTKTQSTKQRRTTTPTARTTSNTKPRSGRPVPTPAPHWVPSPSAHKPKTHPQP